MVDLIPPTVYLSVSKGFRAVLQTLNMNSNDDMRAAILYSCAVIFHEKDKPARVKMYRITACSTTGLLYLPEVDGVHSSKKKKQQPLIQNNCTLCTRKFLKMKFNTAST